MTRRLTDVTEVTSADVDNDAVLVRSESRGFVRNILLKNLFGGLPLLRGAGRALQKTGALVSRGDGNVDFTARIDGDDNGSGRGARLAVAGNRNTNTPAPAAWRLQDASGAWHTIYVDSAGVLRITRAIEVNFLNPRPGREVREISGFQLHDGVSTEKAALDDTDRFVASDEDEAGAPQKYLEAQDLRSAHELKTIFPTNELIAPTTNTGVAQERSIGIPHGLGVMPKMILVWVKPGNAAYRLLGPTGHYQFASDAWVRFQFSELSATSARIRARYSSNSRLHYINTSNQRSIVAGWAGSGWRARFQFFA